MEQKGLHPVGQADKYELLRRVTFDLSGLPPTPQEIDAFVNDPSPDSYVKVVDRLLAAPTFGERWGRHWLDVARYAESTGSTRNYPYEYAWRYRNYVIDSFNADKPYNQFVMEQIAGDLLPYKNAKQHDEHLIGTAFLAMGVKDLNEKDKLKFQMDNVDEQIDVVGKSILGMTISCARCHDHKFDPIPQADYYKLAGIFKSTDILCGLTSRKGANKKQLENDALLVRLDPISASNGSQSSADVSNVGDLERQLAKVEAQLGNQGGKGAKKFQALAGTDKRTAIKKQREEVDGLKQEAKNLQTQLDVLQRGSALAVGVKDAPQITNSPIYEHGDSENPGPVVGAGQSGYANLFARRRFQPIRAAGSNSPNGWQAAITR